VMISTFERRGSASLTFALIFGVLGLAGCTRKEPRREMRSTPVRERAPANWGDFTEAKVCTAARNAAVSTYKDPSDDKTYHSGQK